MFINSDLQKRVMVESIDKIVEYYKKAIYIDPKVRDLRYFLSFLTRLPQIDPHLFSLIYFRKQAVQSFSYTIKFPDEYIPTESEKKQIMEMKERFAKSKLHSLIETSMNGRLMGMSAVKLMWEHDGIYKHHIANKKSYHLTELDFDLESDEKLIFVETDTKTQKSKREPIDTETHFDVRFNPLSGIENDYPGGFLRVNFLRVIIKYWDFFAWSKNNEKSMIYAKYDEQFKARLNEIMEQLYNIGENSVGAFPKGVDVNVLDSLKSETLNSHKELEQSVNRSTSLSIAGQYTATDPGDGHSYAASKVGYNIAADVTLSDLVFAEQQISNQYLMKDYQLNYASEPRNAFPKFEFNKRKFTDAEAMARIITDYANAGIPVVKDDVYGLVGLRIPKEGDETIVAKSSGMFGA